MVWLGVFGISAFTVLIAVLAVTFGEIPEAEASDPFLAEIIHFGGNFAPRGWALCDGQLLAISSNTALFSLLGTTYGGDGRVTFGLPDSRGRDMIHPGSGPGLDTIRLGQKGGTLFISEFPAHTHGLGSAVLQGTNAAGNTATLENNALALSFARTFSTVAPTISTHTDSIAGTTDSAGTGLNISNRDPFVAVNCIIALQGVFPSRN